MGDWWAWPLLLACGAPWIVAIGYYWHRRPRDGAVPMSTAERARQRLWL